MSNASASNVGAALERILPAATRARILRHAPFLLFLGLLVLCAYLAARLSWQFAAAPPVVMEPRAGGAGSSIASGKAAESPSEKIVAAHLFGTHAPDASVTARNAPETSLDLTLAGVAAANPDSLSYAIITSSDNHGKDTYGIGAKLPGGALIRNIYPDRVVIAHDGRLETLRLPWANMSNLIAGSDQPPLLQGFRQQLETHPSSLAEYIRWRPYSKNGHFAGYRIYPRKKPELFRKLGFLPGDIVTSVNGITLTPANTMKALEAFKNPESPVRLGILRNGRHITLTPNLGG
ncbi:MAG: type II secretion system protein GspC [Gammaproteobacteria bacterium]|nr:type II secretion system protein GspC [Gammaproteobacteria bacterium]